MNILSFTRNLIYNSSNRTSLNLTSETSGILFPMYWKRLSFCSKDLSNCFRFRTSYEEMELIPWIESTMVIEDIFTANSESISCVPISHRVTIHSGYIILFAEENSLTESSVFSSHYMQTIRVGHFQLLQEHFQNVFFFLMDLGIFDRNRGYIFWLSNYTAFRLVLKKSIKSVHVSSL